MPSNHLILCRPLLLLPSIFPSIRVFFNESALHIRWPKYWSFSFSISPSNEHPGLISFRMDWLNLLAVQGTLKSLLQHHSSKESILRCSAFFIVQRSHPYMTTGKTIGKQWVSSAPPWTCPGAFSPVTPGRSLPCALSATYHLGTTLRCMFWKIKNSGNNPSEVDFSLLIKISRVGQLQAGTLT